MNATTTMPERPARQGGLAGPAILIGLGVVFLLNNLGLLDWGIWDTLLRLWPLLLIAIGLDLLLGRRSALGAVLVALAVLVGLGMAVWWSGMWMAGGGPLTSETISQPLGTATHADVDIRMGAGVLHVGPLSESGALVEGMIARGSSERILRDFSVSGNTAYFKLQSQSSWAFPFSRRDGEAWAWNLRLNRDTPMRLQLGTGAGQATIDLAQVQVTDLDVNTGVGQTTLTLPERGRVQARINGGVGETTIMIPAGVAARIQANSGLGQVQVLGNYQRQDKSYISPGYDSATERVDLVVSGGVGSITIRQESGR